MNEFIIHKKHLRETQVFFYESKASFEWHASRACNYDENATGKIARFIKAGSAGYFELHFFLQLGA